MSVVPRDVALVVGFLAVGWFVAASVWASPSDDSDSVPMGAERVGWCHDHPTLEDYYGTSDARPPVPCSRRHVAETAAIGRLSGSMAERTELPPPELLARAAARLGCGRRIAGYVGADTVDPFWFLDTQVRFPTEGEWAAGERRYRCDIVPGMLDGSGRPTRVGSLRGLMDRPGSAAIRRCVAGGLIAPCSGQHQAEVITAPGPRTDAACSVQATVYVGQAPDSLHLRSFRYSDASFPGGSACLVADAGGRVRTGTVAAQARSGAR